VSLDDAMKSKKIIIDNLEIEDKKDEVRRILFDLLVELKRASPEKRDG
jgi:hypothetical protein